jgi:hypothetical protein
LRVAPGICEVMGLVVVACLRSFAAASDSLLHVRGVTAVGECALIVADLQSLFVFPTGVRRSSLVDITR